MTDQTVDHRTKVGHLRREKMRRRLLESAVGVFAAKGIDATVIDDVISAAGVSRGTFYNYFKTTNELVTAIGETLSNELVSLIEQHVENIEDPLEILVIGLRLFLQATRERPTLARFFWRAGFNIQATGHLVYQYLPVHISGALNKKKLVATDTLSALELILGEMLACVHAISTRAPERDEYYHSMLAHLFRGLSADESEIVRLLALPLPEIALPEEAMLSRLESEFE